MFDFEDILLTKNVAKFSQILFDDFWHNLSFSWESQRRGRKTQRQFSFAFVTPITSFSMKVTNSSTRPRYDGGTACAPQNVVTMSIGWTPFRCCQQKIIHRLEKINISQRVQPSSLSTASVPCPNPSRIH
jgi:hypothetical protein